MVRPVRQVPPAQLSRIRELLSSPLRAAGLEWAYHLNAAGDRVEAYLAEELLHYMVVLRGADVLIVTDSQAILERFLAKLNPVRGYAFRCREWMAPTILTRFPPAEPTDRGVVLLTYATSDREFARYSDPRYVPRPLTDEDAEEVVAHSGPRWSPEFVRTRVGAGAFYGIRLGGELVSWVGTVWETDQACEIGFAYTRERHRGRGFMKLLTSALTETVLRMRKTPILHAVESNLPAMKVAESLGFSMEAREWAYFSSPQAVP